MKGTATLSGTGWERLINITSEELECSRCHKKLSTHNIVFWCRTGRVVYCDADNCKYGEAVGLCKFQRNEVEHEHVRATLRLQAPTAQT